MSPIALHDTSALRNDGRPPANTCSPADGLIGLGSDALVRGLPWATLLAAACLLQEQALPAEDVRRFASRSRLQRCSA